MSTLIHDPVQARYVLHADAELLADDAAIPSAGEFSVSLPRWQNDSAVAVAATRAGLRLGNTDDVLALWPILRSASRIELSFPAFADGRAYSQARLLRQRCNFRGDLRACGAAVVRDQLGFMARCGFSSFALRADQDVASCLGAFADFSGAYQPAADRQPPAWLRFAPRAARTG